MSQYEQIKQLFQDHPELDLSFYSTLNLNLRTHLASWVEDQDWYAVHKESTDPNIPQTEAVKRAKELLDEALECLKERAESEKDCKGSGIPVLLKHTAASLKKEYENRPLEFVQEFATCLEKEQQILSTIMAQKDMPNHASGGGMCSKQALMQFLQTCKIKTDDLKRTLQTAYLVLTNWPKDVENENMEERDVFGNGQLTAVPYKTFSILRTNMAQSMKAIIPKMEKMLTMVKPHIDCVWKTDQLHACVCRKPEDAEDSAYVKEVCEAICECLSSLIEIACCQLLEQVDAIRQRNPASILPIPSMKSQLDLGLKTLLENYLSVLLVVFDHPPMTMMMEKEKGTKDTEANNSKKFDTAVGILGGEGFRDSIAITAVDIYLCFGQDLADAQKHGDMIPAKKFQILSDKRANQKKGRDPDNQTGPHVREYEGLRVEEFNRKETKHVYRQIYHAVYTVTVQFSMPMWTFNVQAISLPILIRTGAVQASEHVGVQLCHSFVTKNVLDPSATVPCTMKIDDVVQMMNERIRGIGGRGLQGYEMEFLREKLSLVKSAKGSKGQKQEVTLEAFIKDKLTLPPQNIFGVDSKGDEMPFSLWRWFHSVINLLEKTIKQPWLDGVIYGFASRKHCEEILKGKPEGTFLLRFSESTVQGNHENSKGGLGLVGIIEGEPVFAPPIEAEQIEKEGLSAMIRNIQVDQRGFNFVLNTPYDLTYLDKYSKAPQEKEPPAATRYLGFKKMEVTLMAKMERMSVGSPSSVMHSPFHQSIASPASDIYEPSRRKIPKRHSDVESTILQPMSPDLQDGNSQFQMVGVKVQTSTANNIPSMVQSMMSEESFVPMQTTLQPIPIRDDAGDLHIGAQEEVRILTENQDMALLELGDNVSQQELVASLAAYLQQGEETMTDFDSEMPAQIPLIN